MSDCGPGISKDMYKVLKGLDENFQLVIDNLKSEDVRKTPLANFTLQEFWDKLGTTVKALSAECTKFCLAFSQTPLPSHTECEPLVDGLSRSILAMVSVFQALPATEGVTLRLTIKKFLISIVNAARQLIELIRVHGPQGSQAQLQSTGTVWGLCDEFPALPKNNKEAVHAVGKSNLGLIYDAISEMKTARDEFKESLAEPGADEGCDEAENGYDEPQWSKHDYEHVFPAFMLMKVSHGTVKKTIENVMKKGSCDSVEANAELDKIGELLERVSPAVDDIAEAIYPPVDKEELYTQAGNLGSILLNIHSTSKHSHIMDEDDEERIAFFEKVVHHNLAKIDPSGS